MSAMITYKAVSWSGTTLFITAYTESEAREKADKAFGDDGIKEFGVNQ